MGKRFLVVDDSSSTVKKLSRILTGLGHEIAGTAANGIEAIEKFHELKPDAITMDIQMPEMDGLEATKKILAEHPDKPIIIISAHGQESTVMDAIAAGAKFFINKPFDPGQIEDVLEKVLKK